MRGPTRLFKVGIVVAMGVWLATLLYALSGGSPLPNYLSAAAVSSYVVGGLVEDST